MIVVPADAPTNNVIAPQVPPITSQVPPINPVALLPGPRDSVERTYTTQQEKCQVHGCVTPNQCSTINSKFAVTIDIKGHQILYCDVKHFTSTEFMKVIKDQLESLLALSNNNNIIDNATLHECSLSACSKRCPGVFQIYGKPTNQNPNPNKLYCCSITCLINKLNLFNTNSFKTFVKSK